MKVIELMNKIANGEEVPEYVKYYNMLKEKVDVMMVCKENLFYKLDQLEIQLNSRIEIIEEPQEHKIPKKLNLDTDKLRGKETPRTIDYLIEDKINEILDYLEEIEQKRKNK